MRGSRIPSAKRVINSVAPLDPADMSEANANNLMFLWDNMGTGEYVEDAAIAGRHLKQLYAREQASPNLTLEVLAGVAWFATNSFVSFAGGNSPSFTAPAANPRIDILTIRNDGTLQRLVGTEAGSPVAPTIPSTDIPIAQVYNVVGQTKIHDNDNQEVGQGYIQYDLRPFVQVAVGSSAMPKIGLVAKVAVTASNPGAGTLVTTILNFSGAGRLLGLGLQRDNTNPADLVITIDGVVYTLATGTASGLFKLTFRDTTGSSGIMFALAAGAATFAEFTAGIFFKSSLVITMGAINPDNNTVVVAYEHE